MLVARGKHARERDKDGKATMSTDIDVLFIVPNGVRVKYLVVGSG